MTVIALPRPRIRTDDQQQDDCAYRRIDDGRDDRRFRAGCRSAEISHEATKAPAIPTTRSLRRGRTRPHAILPASQPATMPTRRMTKMLSVDMFMTSFPPAGLLEAGRQLRACSAHADGLLQVALRFLHGRLRTLTPDRRSLAHALLDADRPVASLTQVPSPSMRPERSVSLHAGREAYTSGMVAKPPNAAQFMSALLTAVHELTGRRPPPTWTHVDKLQRKLASATPMPSMPRSGLRSPRAG